MADEETTRNPSGWIENAGILAIFGSLGLWLSGLVEDQHLQNAIIVGMPIAGKTVLIAINNAMGGTLASLIGAGPMTGAKLALVGLVSAVGLAFAPVSAYAGEIPPIGCGGGSCSIYVLDVGWPGGVGVNAVEFARFRVGADLSEIVQDTHVSPIGGLCLIPKVGPAVGPFCPSRE